MPADRSSGARWRPNRLNENGTIVQDWSVSSFDHALPVNPNILKQIEIIRGPAAVCLVEMPWEVL